MHWNGGIEEMADWGGNELLDDSANEDTESGEGDVDILNKREFETELFIYVFVDIRRLARCSGG
jgi:hypothetical protein